jgi:hypothetical protein
MPLRDSSNCAYRHAVHDHAYPLRVGESTPLSLAWLLEHTVLFDEIIDNCLLPVVSPACQSDCNEVERLYSDCHCTHRLSDILFGYIIVRRVPILAPYGIAP